jgi:hypothetical protein
MNMPPDREDIVILGHRIGGKKVTAAAKPDLYTTDLLQGTGANL